MSASTVSITANPAARRRPIVVADKKSNHTIELVATENGPNPNGNAVTVDAQILAASSKDLSHNSIRGEAKDGPSVKKTVGNTVVPLRRTRKLPAKAEKPWWLTVVSVFAKNFVLLLVVLGFVQLIRRLAVKSPPNTDVTNPSAYSDLEGRIAEVENRMKKTSGMIQLQVDVVDKKIEDKIGGIWKELSDKIDGETGTLEAVVRKLELKSESLESSLKELKGKEWLLKDDFENFVKEFNKDKGSGAGGFEDVSLDDIKAYARDVVMEEIAKHAADGLGRVDYALASGGAMVVKHSEVYSPVRGIWSLWNNRNGVHGDADKMLKPSFGEPGQCFPLEGSSGFVQIRLRAAIFPEAFSLEHVAKGVAYDRASAPKDCRVTGLLQGSSDAASSSMEFALTEFTYDLEKSSVQTFNVVDDIAPGLIDTVNFYFSSNHGSPTHTCIYRLRVHGHEPSDALAV